MITSSLSRSLSCLSRPVSRALLIGACAIAAYAPRAADACGVPAPELHSTVPTSGTSYPANAALLFNGFDISLDAVTVTVDGQPASFVPAAFAEGFADIAVLVDPQPQAGQTVVVSGSFCPPEFCQMTTLTYTAAAPDATPPAPIADMAYFGVYDHADFMSGGGDCQGSSDLTFYLHVPQSAPADGEALPIYRATWDPDGEGGVLGLRDTARAPDGEARLVMSALVGTLLGKDPTTEVCIDVEAVDSAGNAAPAFQVCPACYFREDDAPIATDTPAEPDWTDADAVPGSACAVAGESSGGDPTGGAETGEPETSGEADTGSQDEGKGCACSTDVGSRDLGALAFGLLLGLVRKRRR